MKKLLYIFLILLISSSSWAGRIVDLPLIDSLDTKYGNVTAGTIVRASVAWGLGKDGVLQEYAADTPMFGENGYQHQGAGTNQCLKNQDFSDATWTKSNMTTGAATGLDGTSDAIRLTASAADATCLQTIATLSNTEHTTSVYVKRVTGSGVVSITDNNGVNWTALTDLVSDEWTRYDIQRTQTDPVVGIKIATDTDVVDVDLFQVEEDQSYPSAPIITDDVPVARATSQDYPKWTMGQELKNILSVDEGWSTSEDDETGVTEYKNSYYDGQSWLWTEGVDLSSFASDSKAVILRDSSGNLAWGFLGEVGTGEALGSELVTNGTFETNIDDASVQNAGTGGDATVYRETGSPISGAGSLGVIQTTQPSEYFRPSIQINLSQVINIKIHYVVAFTSKLKSGACSFSSSNGLLVGGSGSNVYLVSESFVGEQNWEVTCWGNKVSPKILFYLDGSASNFDLLFDNFSLKEITEPAATAVHIYKDPALTQEGWNMESGFTPNDESTFDIVPASELTYSGTMILELHALASEADYSAEGGLVASSDASDSILQVTAGGDLQTEAAGATVITLDNNLAVDTDYSVGIRWGYYDTGVLYYQLGEKHGGLWTWQTHQVYTGSYDLGTYLRFAFDNEYPFDLRQLVFFDEAMTQKHIENFKYYPGRYLP